MTAYIYVYVDIIIYDICTIPAYVYVYIYIYIYIIHIYVIYIIYTYMCVCGGGGVYICLLQFSLFIYCKHEVFNGFFIEFENPEKQTGSGGEDIEFPGVLKKAYGKCGNSRDQLKKKWDFQGCSRKNHPWNIHGFQFLTLGFPGGVTQFFRISIGESLFFKGKVTNLKIPRIFSEKFILNPPPFGFLICKPIKAHLISFGAR